MRINVAENADFKRQVHPALEELQEAENTGDEVLEVLIAPGEYRGKGLVLGQDDAERPVHLMLRASDPAHPPVFTDMFVRLAAAQVTVSGLVMRGNYYEPSVFRIGGAHTLTVQNCAFINNRNGTRDDTWLVELVADHEDSRAVVENCWFIGNRTAPDSTLLAFRDSTGSYRQVMLRHCAFLNNQASVLIAPHVTTRLEMQQCFIYEPGDATLVAVNDTDTGVRISDSVIASASAENVLSYYAYNTKPDAFQPALITKTAFTSGKDGGSLPGKIQREQVTTHVAALMNGDALDKQLAHFSDQAASGTAPDIDALQKAFGV